MTELAELGPTSQPHLRWLVLYVRPRYETKVVSHITQAGIESFLPLRTELRQWSDRKKLVEVPVFTGYVFVHVDERHRVAALESDGALKYVGFGGRLSVVRDDTIESLKIALRRSESLEIEEDWLRPGTRVLLIQGPFAGMRGVLIERRGRTRIMITVEAIAKAVSVEVSIADIRVVEDESDG